MKTNTINEIYKLLENQGLVGPSVIASALGISSQMVHRHLKSLLAAGRVRKQGAPPKVLYFAVQQE